REVAGVGGVAVGVVGHLSGEVQDRLRARHLDRLAVARRVEDAGRAVLLELGHVVCVKARAPGLRPHAPVVPTFARRRAGTRAAPAPVAGCDLLYLMAPAVRPET